LVSNLELRWSYRSLDNAAAITFSVAFDGNVNTIIMGYFISKTMLVSPSHSANPTIDGTIFLT
jgi:hypothetical protein